TTNTSWPLHTTFELSLRTGGVAIRRQLLRLGLYTAPCEPARTTYSFPVQTPTGCWLPGSGAFGNACQAFVAGLYATPSENASPQQPPPQPSSSLPVHTTAP